MGGTDWEKARLTNRVVRKLVLCENDGAERLGRGGVDKQIW